jgi:hypothetical protein
VTPHVLHDSERQAAFGSLPDEGLVSLRQLSDCWGWSVARVRRFLAALQRAGLIDVETSKYGTRITRHRPAHIGTHRHKPAHLKLVETKGVTGPDPAHVEPLLGFTGLKQPPRSNPGSVENSKVKSKTLDVTPLVAAFAAKLIEKLNAAQRDNRRIDDLRKIRPDQNASLAVVEKWVTLGVELQWAIDYVWNQGQVYNPKPGKPQIKSLRYFWRGLPKAWGERNQQQLGLIALEDGGQKATAAPPAETESPEDRAAVMADLKLRLAQS